MPSLTLVPAIEIVIEVVSSKVGGFIEKLTVCCWAKAVNAINKNIDSKVFFIISVVI
ncbi:hypothetical protein D3C72_2316510 [compost metagenome]